MNPSFRPLTSLLPESECPLLWSFLEGLVEGPARLLLHNDLLLALQGFLEDPEQGRCLADFVQHIQELQVGPGLAIVHHRPQIGRSRYYRLCFGESQVEELSVRAYLDHRDEMAEPTRVVPPQGKLVLDFQSFYDFGPSIRDPRKVGQGLRILNSYLASNLSRNAQHWLQSLLRFLEIHQIQDQQLLLQPGRVHTPEALYDTIVQALDRLSAFADDTPAREVEPLLENLGIAPGFGNTAGRIRGTMERLLDLFEEPEPGAVEDFLERIPMVSRIAIFSPHGWFGQENVLGRPDTGGQIVYILDQVRALEQAMSRSLEESGLEHVQPQVLVLTRLIPQSEGTSCHEPRERILGTRNAWIMRVPFRNPDGSVHPTWISRFEVWPYLEQFALECQQLLEQECQGRPDAIIGNYSDGCLVASLVATWMGVIQVNIAHALEKSKYLFSALYWREHERTYHFSSQFTADLLAMNRSDFVITSSLQEIVGTPTTMGQYESYVDFTMPGLYQVTGGVNLFHPKFNVIPPGVDEETYYPPGAGSRELAVEMEELLFRARDRDIVGELSDPGLVPIFSMARLDRIKNITGLLEAFGRSEKLKRRCNLILVAGKVHWEEADDAEERAEIERMYRLLEVPGVAGRVRWLGKHLRKNQAGEAYRVIADRRGLFVQPALFEAFGLTVLEAMASGVPTFATCFGGPQEILSVPGSGVLVNPTRSELLAGALEEFVEAAEADPGVWETLSRGGLRRVRERYNWQLHSRELLKRLKLYGFWRYAAALEERQGVQRYCEALFHLLYRPLARSVPGGEVAL